MLYNQEPFLGGIISFPRWRRIRKCLDNKILLAVCIIFWGNIKTLKINWKIYITAFSFSPPHCYSIQDSRNNKLIFKKRKWIVIYFCFLLLKYILRTLFTSKHKSNKESVYRYAKRNFLTFFYTFLIHYCKGLILRGNLNRFERKLNILFDTCSKSIYIQIL